MFYIHQLLFIQLILYSTADFVNCTFEEVACPLGVVFGTGRCLPRDRVCDSIIDCVGGSDEQDCPGYMYRISLGSQALENSEGAPGTHVQTVCTRHSLRFFQHLGMRLVQNMTYRRSGNFRSKNNLRFKFSRV